IDGKTPSLGQGAMAASVPVAIASNQSAVPVSVASLPLPSSAATSALQATGNTSLSAVDTKLGAVDTKLGAIDAKFARLAPTKGSTVKVSFTGTGSSWVSINAGGAARYYTLSCTQYCYIAFGTSGMAAVANTDFLLPPGVHDFLVEPAHGVRVLSDGVDGVLCITPSGT
ncbi:MAG: hypothetical protein JXM71_11605, partial [Spirochaetales bacterium]|nr:hypothetical protein [Spirochaetales bacterium]